MQTPKKLYILFHLIIIAFIFNLSLLNAQTIINPRSLPGLQLWLSADTGVVLNGGAVAQWADRTGNGNQAVQSNILNQPTFINSIIDLNNQPALRFGKNGLSGDETFLSFPQISITPNNLTAFFVYKNAGNVNTIQYVIADVGKGISNGGVNYPYDLITEGSNILSSVINPLEYGIMTFYNDKIFRNGIQSVTSGNPVSGMTFNTIGTRPDVLFLFFYGDLTEVLIYDTVLNSVNQKKVEQYLSNKYAPPITLPSDISIINSFCDTILMPAGHFTSYLWSTGAITSSISVNNTGKYWVRGTNIFGESSADTIQVTFTRPDHFSLRDSAFCSGDSLQWNTNLQKNNYTFQWQDNSTDSLFNITQAGNYYVKISDAFGCSITTDTVKITEDSFSTNASLGPDIPLCSGNSITLTSGASPTNSYIWNTGSTSDSLFITNTGQYSVIVTNTNNCAARDTINVTILGLAPIANFTTSIGCVNNSVTFINSSVPPAGDTFTLTSWNFGDSNTSSLFNPSHTYTNTGTYTVSVLVQTDAPCSQSITKTITISPVPTASFVSGIACQNDSTNFVNLSTSTTGYSVIASNWNFGDGTNSNLNSPKHVFANPIIYTTKLLVTNNAGCKDSIYKTVNVQGEVKANFTNSPACTNIATHFQSTSTIPSSGSPTYAWNFGNSTANTPTPIKTYTNSGVYYVTLTVDGTNGCTSTITKLLNVYLPPIASFSISSFCSKDTATIINLSSPQSGIISSYNWKLNTTNFSAVQSPTLSLTNTGNYSVRLTTINSFGCKDSATNSLTVFPLPIVDFITNPTAYYYINEPVNFIPSITNASSYLWNINSVPTSTIQSPTELFNSEGTYTTSLNLKDQQGCKNTKTKTINVFKRGLDLAILNVTTSKDDDGFITVVADLANYGSVPISSFNVHYQTSDAGNIKETWNGTLLPNSFYVYTFNAKSASTQNNANNITCVEIEKVNAIIDDVTSNNYLCNTLNPDEISVSNPIPNPSSGDIKLPIITNKDIDYTIVIYNSTGQIQSEEVTKKVLAGLNFVSLPTSSYARGSYIIKITIDDKVFIKKFIKIDNQ